MTVTQICKRLIRKKSLSGEERDVAAETAQIMRECGFDEIEVDRYGNVIGTVNGNRAGRRILFDAHIDTVPVSDLDDWSRDPFAAEEKDGRIYGRGASDMKGALAAMLYAGGIMAQRRNFAGKLTVSAVVHEERFEGVAAREISTRYKPDFVVIGEASELRLNLGQRGRAEIVCDTFGKCAHSSNPRAGINAVRSMLKLCAKIDEMPLSHHEKLGDGIMELTDIISSPYPGMSVVPNLCRVTYDRRTLAGETEESILKPIEQAIERLYAEDSTFSAKVGLSYGEETCYTGEKISGKRFFPAWLTSEDSELVALCKRGLENAGMTPKIGYYSFCTNGSHYAGEAQIPTVGFGPSRENQAHVRDEYIEISQLEAAARGYIGIAESVLDVR